MSARLGPGIKCETAIGRSEPKVGRARLRNGYWYSQSLRWILTTPCARQIRCQAAAQRNAAKPAWRLVERFGGGAPRAAARQHVGRWRTVSSKSIPNLVTINMPFRSLAPPTLGFGHATACSTTRPRYADAVWAWEGREDLESGDSCYRALTLQGHARRKLSGE